MGHSWVWGGREDFLQAGALLIGECGRLFPCVLTLGAVGITNKGVVVTQEPQLSPLGPQCPAGQAMSLGPGFFVHKMGHRSAAQ